MRSARLVSALKPAVGAITHTGIDREAIAAVLWATAFGIQLTATSLATVQGALWYALLVLAFAVSPKQRVPGWALLGLTTILASGGVAILVAERLGVDRQAAATLTTVLMMLPMAGLVYSRTEKTFPWLVALAFVLSAGIFYDAATVPGRRPTGFADNPNPAAGFLLLMAVYVASSPRRWPLLALPLLIAVGFTGSRLALGLAAVLIPLALVCRYRNAGTFGQIALASGFLLFLGLMPGLLWGAGVHPGLDDTRGRLLIGHWDWRMLPPMGFPAWRNTEGAIHDVPLLIASEFGALAALAWLGLGLRALWMRPRLTPAWWGLLAVMALSTLDLYTWFGPVGFAWWLLLGVRMRENRAKSVTVDSQAPGLGAESGRQNERAAGERPPAAAHRRARRWAFFPEDA